MSRNAREVADVAIEVVVPCVVEASRAFAQGKRLVPEASFREVRWLSPGSNRDGGERRPAIRRVYLKPLHGADCAKA